MSSHLPRFKDSFTLIKEENGVIDLGLTKDELKILPSWHTAQWWEVDEEDLCVERIWIGHECSLVPWNEVNMSQYRAPFQGWQHDSLGMRLGCGYEGSTNANQIWTWEVVTVPSCWVCWQGHWPSWSCRCRVDHGTTSPSPHHTWWHRPAPCASGSACTPQSC